MSALTPHINAWKWAVSGKPKGEWPEVVETGSEVEYRQFVSELFAASNAAKTAGIPTFMKGTDNKSGGKKMILTANGKRITVAYVPKPRIQAVTDTSRESYSKVNLGAKCLEVAKAAISIQAKSTHLTDRIVAEALGWDPSTVSARRNEIENAGFIKVENSKFRIENCGLIFFQKTNRRVNAWRLVEVVKELEQLHLFH